MHDMSRAKGFPCKECDMVCPSTPSLLEHMKAHYQQEEPGRFECEQCGRVYKHATSLANHKKSHEVGSFQCPVCTRTLPNAVALKNHLRIHTLSPSSAHPEEETEEAPEEGPQDDRDFSLSQSLSGGFGRNVDHDSDDHRKKGSPEPDDAWDRPFKCDQCDRTYRHHGSLVNHKKCHQEGDFKCSVCFKQFGNLAALNSHERTHSKFKPPVASMVSTSGSSSGGGATQSSQSDDSASCFCHLCQIALPTKADFQEHIVLHNTASPSLGLPRSFPGIMPHNLSTVRSPAYTPGLGDPLPLPPLPTEKRGPYDPIMGPPVNNPIYTCAYCGAGHPDLESLKVHYLTHDPHPASHRQDSNILNSDTLSSGSQGSVSSPSGGRVPQANSPDDAERRFKCGECGKSYRHAGSLVNHKRCHQTGLYQCTICCKQYPHLAALHSHLRSHKGRTSNQPMNNDGNDWLSSEPLTLDSQQSYVQEGSGATTPISLPGNLGDAAHFVPDGGHSSGLDSLEFHDRFDGSSLSQSSSAHRQADRHVCADCGEMYNDVSGIKSHMCPRRGQTQQQTQQPQGNMSNGFMGNMNYHSSSGSSLPSGSNGSNLKESSSQRPFPQSSVKRLGPNDKEEDDDGEIYQCSVCGNHYASLRALRSHLRSHANNPSTPGPSNLDQDWRMICSTCGQSFARKQDLLNHQLIHGPQRSDGPQGMSNSTNGNEKIDGRNICVDCGLFFPDRHHLVTHLCSGKSRVAPGLNGAKDRVAGGSHDMGADVRRLPIEQSDKPHKCDQCGRGYRHPCSLLNHKKSHKTGVFRCLVCQKRYYNLLALKNHQRTHFDLKRHKCEECGKAFKIQKQLINHLRLHEEHRAKGLVRTGSNTSRFQQPGTSQLQALRADATKPQVMGVKYNPQGFKKPYSSAGTSRPQKFDAAESSRRPFSCEECGKTYRHAGSLANHKNLHKIGDYHCNVCNSTYPNRLAMKNHLRLHFAQKKHNCQECGKGFRTQRQLATHTTAGLCKGPQGSVQQMDFECDGCCEGFATADDLSAHDCPAQHLPSSSSNNTSTNASIDRNSVETDSDERPYVCDLCNCAYKHASSLLNHKHTHKTGNFRCNFCDKPYTNYMALRNHMRIHTQRKKHICHTCGKAFRLARFLRNHQKVHEEGATPFGCPSCGKSFQGRSGLARHRCGDNQVGMEVRRKPPAPAGEGEECRYTYMVSNPASMGPYACRNSDFSEVWTN